MANASIFGTAMGDNEMAMEAIESDPQLELFASTITAPTDGETASHKLLHLQGSSIFQNSDILAFRTVIF